VTSSLICSWLINSAARHQRALAQRLPRKSVRTHPYATAGRQRSNKRGRLSGMLHFLFAMLWPVFAITTVLAVGGLTFVFFATRTLD
jgi:hypothetical protein